MATKAEKTEAIDDLKALLQPGDTVYCILRQVSKSGMSRVIDLYLIRDNEPRRISWTAAQAIGWTYDRKWEGIKVKGCGMDMGFHLVDTLASVLFYGDGKAWADTRLVSRWL